MIISTVPSSILLSAEEVMFNVIKELPDFYVIIEMEKCTNLSNVFFEMLLPIIILKITSVVFNTFFLP